MPPSIPKNQMILKEKNKTPTNECYNTMLYSTGRRSLAVLDLEAVPSHARLVLLNCGFAFLLWVVRLGEQHAVVAGGLLGLADAAGLESRLVATCAYFGSVGSYLGLLGLGRWSGYLLGSSGFFCKSMC